MICDVSSHSVHSLTSHVFAESLYGVAYERNYSELVRPTDKYVVKTKSITRYCYTTLYWNSSIVKTIWNRC